MDQHSFCSNFVKSFLHKKQRVHLFKRILGHRLEDDPVFWLFLDEHVCLLESKGSCYNFLRLCVFFNKR